MDDRSWTLALPAVPPPPTCVVPVWLTPQLQDRTSISPLCPSNADSPSIPSIFRNIAPATLPSVVYVGGGWKLRRFRRRKLRGKAQRHRKPLELVMRLQEELGRVVARVAGHLLHHDLRRREGALRLDLLGGVGGIAVHI